MFGSARSSVTTSRVLVVSALLCACAGGEVQGLPDNPFASHSGGGAAGSSEASETDGSSGSSPTTSEGGSDSDSGTGTMTTTSATSDSSTGGPECVDLDGDMYGEGCEAGPDCNDADPTVHEGPACTCMTTPDDKAADSCSEGMIGFLGVLGEGGVVPPKKGVITGIDNGSGNGHEDWYWVEFPEAMAMGPRPGAGKLSVTFAVNPGDPANPDYALEVYRSCGGQPFEGLSSTYGPNTPPVREWDFFDDPKSPEPNPNPNPNYVNNVPWPSKVYIRVFRVNNDGACSEYTLQVAWLPG
ncbi:MAG TPA: hypothetical protein VIK91_07760 [Nannocystis sp.]